VAVLFRPFGLLLPNNFSEKKILTAISEDIIKIKT
jgi:hypothetical protein